MVGDHVVRQMVAAVVLAKVAEYNISGWEGKEGLLLQSCSQLFGGLVLLPLLGASVVYITWFQYAFFQFTFAKIIHRRTLVCLQQGWFSWQDAACQY